MGARAVGVAAQRTARQPAQIVVGESLWPLGRRIVVELRWWQLTLFMPQRQHEGELAAIWRPRQREDQRGVLRQHYLPHMGDHMDVEDPLSTG